MDKITRMQLEDVIEQVIHDLNPGLGDDALVEAIESGDYHREAMEFIIETLQAELSYRDTTEIPVIPGFEDSMAKFDKLMNIRKN